MALHNSIRESHLQDNLFERCDQDEDYIPNVSQASSSQHDDTTSALGHEESTSALEHEESDMNTFRDNIADALMSMRG
jgi:hypothetical protein